MEKGITFVGMDTSKAKIQLSVRFAGETEPVDMGLANRAADVRRMVRKVQRKAPGEVEFCYEAGPCGYALQRQIVGLGSRCKVVAPSLIPVKPGERIKTDRRDARKLRELLEAGLLTEVRPPTSEEEAARDLCRAREDAVEDRQRSRHRMGKLVLRRGLVYGRGGAWTQGHYTWLRSLVWEHATERAVFDDYMLAIEQVDERLKDFDAKLEELAQQEPYREKVGWLKCFRGIKTITAMTVLTELHGFQRFSSARGLMAYLGLVPSEHSSGESVRRGKITGAGNVHVRRVLVEAGQNYRLRPSVRGAVLKRREGQPGWVIAIADRAQQRLHRRMWRLLGRGKPHNKAVVAVARELVGFIWAVMQGPTAQGPDATENVQQPAATCVNG
jgi:transposase